MPAFSFPSSREPGPISLRAPPFDPFYVSDKDEKTISAAINNNKKGGGEGLEIK